MKVVAVMVKEKEREKKKKKKKELEKILNEAARIVTGTTKLISIHALYVEIGRDTFEEA